MTRHSALLAVPVSVALVSLAALPAAAVVDTQTWTSGSHQWWSSGTWSSGEIPEDGDTLIFPSTSAPQSDVDYNVTLAGITFAGPHTLGSANGGSITLAGSGTETLRVDGSPDPAAVTFNTNVATTGDQTWIVAPGNTLAVPSWITADAAAELNLHVDGTLWLTGNLDGQVTGEVRKTGAGSVIRQGGAGGAIGGGGLSVESGAFFVDHASIGGTDFHLNGGELYGAGTVGNLLLTSGWFSPTDGYEGPDGAIGGPFTVSNAQFNGGAFGPEVDGDSGNGDLVVVNGTLSGVGTILDLWIASQPEEGQSFTLIQASSIDPAFRLLDFDASPLDEGDEFTQYGLVWSISYADNAVTVTFLGVAPETEEPEEPTDRPGTDDEEELAETGIADGMPAIAAGAVIALLAGAGLLVAMRRRATV